MGKKFDLKRTLLMTQYIHLYFNDRQVQQQLHQQAQLRQLQPQQQQHWPLMLIAIKSLLVIKHDMQLQLQARVDRKIYLLIFLTNFG